MYHTQWETREQSSDKGFGMVNASIEVDVNGVWWGDSPAVEPLPLLPPLPVHPLPEVREGTDISLYNQSIANEAAIFDSLLFELLKSVEEPEQAMGRPRIPDRDALFSMLLKVYCRKSGRRTQQAIRDAHDRGYLEKPWQYNVISKGMMREEFTYMLYDLIRLSAVPLSGLETEFAIDSTGLSTSNFGPFANDKWHEGRKKNEYVKLHAICGTRSNVFTSVRITSFKGKGSGDVSNFERLVKETAQNFQIDVVTGDKAYQSRANMDLTEKLGGEAYIPFKEGNSRHGRGSSAWERSYHTFTNHRDEWDEVYHRRSNIESAFGSLKRKFGHTLLSRHPIALENEALSMALAHNICQLIRAMYLLGIEPEFQPM